MKSILRKTTTPYGIIVAIACIMILFFAATWVSRAQADSPRLSAGQRLITVHDRGHERGLLTRATTLRDAFKEAGIPIDPNDRVEPGLDDELVATNYEANIYRARPVTIVDGTIKKRVMSPYQTPEQIMKHAKMQLHDEDITTLTASNDIIGGGTGVELTIDRATPFVLVLYGKQIAAYTQEKTVGEMLEKKGITLGKKDTLSVSRGTEISEGVKVEIWRNGKQTVTEEQKIAFETEEIQDADRPVGYREVKTPGVKGEKNVTYEIVMKNGKETSRKEIQSVVTKKPKKEVVIVGSKPSFSGGFADALAKLRACESGGNYANKNNPLYRGAYQFGYGTWGNKYGIYDPADASPAQQDQAARELYERRGWQPWPHCGAGLPDTYR